MDKDFEPIIVALNDWELVSVTEPSNKNFFDNIIIKISDPFERERELQWNLLFEDKVIQINKDKSLELVPFGHQGFHWEEDGVMEGLKNLKMLSKFKCWEHYDLHLENELLRATLLRIVKSEKSKNLVIRRDNGCYYFL